MANTFNFMKTEKRNAGGARIYAGFNPGIIADTQREWEEKEKQDGRQEVIKKRKNTTQSQRTT